MKIIITGGAGFIGSNLIRYILKNTNNTVLNIDNLTYAGNLISLKSIKSNPRYIFKKIDICNKEKIFRAIFSFKPDLIMHLAAETHVDRSIESPDSFIKTNLLGTYNLLEASLNYWRNLNKKDKRKFRFHHISTDEVFGSIPQNIFPKEGSTYNPSSPYSASKAGSDYLVKSWHVTYELPILLSNCSNNYGPFQFPEKLIPLMVLNAINNKKLTIYGDGKNKRDWLFVEDHVRALYLIAKRGKVGEAYNISGGQEKTNLEVVQNICEILDGIFLKKYGLCKTFKSQICFIKDRPGHDFRYALNSNKIKNSLGWAPKESFKTGLKKTIIWYLKNEHWCRNVLKK